MVCGAGEGEMSVEVEEQVSDGEGGTIGVRLAGEGKERKGRTIEEGE